MRKKDKANYDRPNTVIGHETVIEADNVNCGASLQVSGQVIGDMKVAESLVIGEKGLVKGNINAGFMLVAGAIEGDVEVINQIHLTKTAEVRGDIRCGSIVIDEGAKIYGSFTMYEKESQQEE